MKLFLINILVCLIVQSRANAAYIETSDIAVGVNHVCAQTSAGVKCFGDAENVTVKVPTTIKAPRDLKAGNRFTCLFDNTIIKCFGEIPGTTKTELTIGSDQLKSPRMLAVGYSHACAVGLNDKIKCWGTNDSKESTAPALKSVTELSLGMQHSCAIAENNVVCWGNKTFGSLDVPVDLKNPRNLTSGWWHHCVETDDGLKCWGYPYQSYVAPDDLTLKNIAAGGMFNCGISETGVKCWNETGKTALVEGTAGAIKLAMGATHACAITSEHGVVCWKYSNNGVYKLMMSYVPNDGIKNIQNIASGNASLCAYGDEDQLKCWGKNFAGALNVPSTVKGPLLALTSNQQRTCLLASDSTLSCFGNYHFDVDMPADLGKVDMVSSGGFHVCAANKDKLACWGDDVRDAITVPKNLTNITDVSAGFTHGCAVANGEVVCWGGTGLISGINPVKKLKNPKSICAGGTFSCGVASNGTVTCWGKQIPFVDQMFPNKDAALDVPKNITNATEVSCGLGHACSIYNGKIKCWGGGAGAVAPGLTVKNPHSLSSGWNHNCVIGDQGLYCWGNTAGMTMPNYSLTK